MDHRQLEHHQLLSCQRQGHRLGFKVLSVPKADHIRVFGEAPVNAVIEEVQHRWVTLRLEI